MSVDRMLNLRALEIFSAVVEAGGMTLAASQLGLTQSAVSQAIRTLEDTLQVTLFDRSVRPPALTMLGQVVAQHATGVNQRVRALEQAIRFGSVSRVPLLRIGMVDSFVKTVAPQLLRRLDDMAQQWVVLSGPGVTRIDAVSSRRLDMIITTFEGDLPADLFEIPILTEPCFVVAPRGYEELGTIAELSHELDFIRSGPNLHISGPIEQYLLGQGVVPPKTYEFSSVDAAIRMVEEGLGWTIVFPLGVLSSYLEGDKGRTVAVPLPAPSLTRRLRLVGHRANGDEFAQRIAATSREILEVTLMPTLRDRLPWLIDKVKLG